MPPSDAVGWNGNSGALAAAAKQAAAATTRLEPWLGWFRSASRGWDSNVADRQCRLREHERLASSAIIPCVRADDQKNLETAVEYLPRPRQWTTAHRRRWRRPRPAEMALFLAGPNTLQAGAHRILAE